MAAIAEATTSTWTYDVRHRRMADNAESMHAEAVTRTRLTYNSAADSYDDPVNSFWNRFGRRTVDRLNLREGARVLDVCCGSGASAIPAAEKVGASGFVLGIDLAENLLALARAKAAARGLRNTEFRMDDILDVALPPSSFDAAICVFGIFFLPDMERGVRQLWQLVRNGGRLAITTWGPRFLEPASTVFWNAIRLVRSDLYRAFNPWDRLTDPDAIRSLFLAAGVEVAEIGAEAATHSLACPEDWWTIVLGSGYRGTVDQLDADDRDEVRRRTLAVIRDSKIRSVEANVIYATAQRAATSRSVGRYSSPSVNQK